MSNFESTLYILMLVKKTLCCLIRITILDTLTTPDVIHKSFAITYLQHYHSDQSHIALTTYDHSDQSHTALTTYDHFCSEPC